MYPENREVYELGMMKDASLQAQISWSMKALAIAMKTTKKALREVWKVLNKPEFEDEVLIRGKLVEKRFFHGFRSFTLTKGAKQRKILAPHPTVQKVFRTIGKTLVELKPAHKNAFGFVKKRSAFKATRRLMGNSHYLSFDIADAFPSITISMVRRSLEGLEISKAVVEPLAWLVTYHYERERRLPQGSSCSPALLNLVYLPMCAEIDRFCRKRKIKWSVYADDFNLASETTILPAVKQELLRIPNRFGFSVKKEKIKDNLGKTIPHMLGLTIVERKIHLKRRLKKKYRRIFYMACEYDAYPKRVVVGIAMNIRQVYGREKNWPGSLSKYWILYKEKKRKEAER